MIRRRAIDTALHVVSWNVAGWSTTTAAISQRHGSVGSWLERHSVDILCLQEVKVSREKLNANLGTYALPGFDGFWAPSGAAGKGMNGVATFVRSTAPEAAVVGVDFAPLGDTSLDSEGRCIVTVHACGIACINIYAPNDGDGGKRLPVKSKFLIAIDSLIIKLKSEGCKVMLLGDFNLFGRARDQSHDTRWLDLDFFMSNQKINLPATPAVKKVVGELCSGVARKIGEALENSVIIEDRGKWRIKLSNSENRETKSKSMTASVFFGSSGSSVSSSRSFGSHQPSGTVPISFFSQEDVDISRSLKERVVEGHVYKRAGRICMQLFWEVFYRITGKRYGLGIQRQFADVFGEPRCPPGSVGWLSTLLTQGGMRDSFLEYHEDAEDRFTVWEQYRNHRYCNRGARIDFILVDEKLKTRLVAPLPLEATDAATAAKCATACRLWQPAPLDGSGLGNQGSPEAFEWEFSCSDPPRTGLIYTAPVFSDHIAVSAVIEVGESDLQPENTVVELDLTEPGFPMKSPYLKQLEENLKKSKVEGVCVSGIAKRQNSIKSLFQRMQDSPDPKRRALE